MLIHIDIATKINVIMIFLAISPISIFIIAILYAILLITSIILIIKNENSNSTILWLLLVFFAPFLGAIIYITKYFISKG